MSCSFTRPSGDHSRLVDHSVANQDPPEATVTFHRLLVPLDGSHLAEAVLPVVTRLAQSCGATILLLHLLEKDAPSTVHGERHLTNRAEAESYLDELVQRLSSPNRTIEHHTHEVPVGDVAAGIATHVGEHAIDLIVLDTH